MQTDSIINVVTIQKPQQSQIAAEGQGNGRAERFDAKLEKATRAAEKLANKLEAQNNKQAEKETKPAKADDKVTREIEPSDKLENEFEVAGQDEPDQPKVAGVASNPAKDNESTSIEEELPNDALKADASNILMQIMPAPMLVQNIVQANNAGAGFGQVEKQPIINAAQNNPVLGAGNKPEVNKNLLQAMGINLPETPAEVGVPETEGLLTGKQQEMPKGILIAQEKTPEGKLFELPAVAAPIQQEVTLPQAVKPEVVTAEIAQVVESDESQQPQVATSDVKEENTSQQTSGKDGANPSQTPALAGVIAEVLSDKKTDEMLEHVKNALVKQMQAKENADSNASNNSNVVAATKGDSANTEEPKADKSQSKSPFAGFKLPHENAANKADSDSGINPLNAIQAKIDQSQSTTQQSASSASDAGKAIGGAKSQVLDQVIMKVYEGAKDGSQKVTVRLDPPELGRVDVKIDFAPDGKASLSISADSRATLDILQKHSRELERGLLDSGIKTDMGSLSFNLNGQNQGGFFAQQDDYSWKGNPYARYVADGDDSANQVSPAAIARVYSLSPDSVNILV